VEAVVSAAAGHRCSQRGSSPAHRTLTVVRSMASNFLAATRTFDDTAAWLAVL
jgi:hypothetical protein